MNFDEKKEDEVNWISEIALANERVGSLAVICMKLMGSLRCDNLNFQSALHSLELRLKELKSIMIINVMIVMINTCAMPFSTATSGNSA